MLSRPLRVLAMFGVVCVVLSAYLLGMRPWFLRWGANADEITKPLPGDDLCDGFLRSATRAIDIDAPPAQIWPWIAQIGQDRGGFYSYAFLENLFGARIRNADGVMGLSDPVVGDKMWMTPPDRFDGVGYATYGVVEPGRALVVRTRVFRSPEPIGIWSFILEPREGGSRFLVRSASCSSRILTRGEEIFETLMFEPMHFVMERRMMIGVRDRAEGRAWSKAGDVIDPLCWIFALVAALAAAFLVVMPRHGTPYLLPFTVALLYLLSEPFTGNPWGSLAQSVVLIGLFSLARRASARTTESESLSL